MLAELVVRDLALIESAELALGPGLDVLTGETGAGKSLLVGALELLLGRTPPGGAGRWVRRGAERARVEGRFVLAGDARARVREHLARELPALADEDDDGDELVVGRTLSAEGRTRAHVNHRPVPLRALRALAPLLLEIHGQNDHQRLLEPAEQTRLVDAFGGLEPARTRYHEARAAWRAALAEERERQAARSDRRDRLELLRFQAGELERAELSPGERAGLVEERTLLRDAEELARTLGGLVDELAEADGALVGRLGGAQRSLERWREAIPRVAAALEDLRAAEVHAEEAAAALASLRDTTAADPARLELVEGRLAELERLEHKYERDEAGLLERAEEIEREIAALEHDEEEGRTLAERLAAAREELAQAGDELARGRRALSKKLSKAVVGALGELGLAGARLELAFRPREGDDEERFGPDGIETLELLLSANAGEPPAPLRAVASGGETARIMLALRGVLSAGDRGRTLVFDEIDSGVGGRLGPRVGAHLRALSAAHQVLCVTHLPAIAAAADVHLHVTKEVRRGRTTTTIASLEGESRVSEVADMIAGGAAERTALAEARRLVAESGAAR